MLEGGGQYTVDGDHYKGIWPWFNTILFVVCLSLIAIEGEIILFVTNEMHVMMEKNVREKVYFINCHHC